ncbi:MAG: arsenic resistance protein [Coriobacteriia bacterium]|nr:arsenic resistance protein [Coriobacteriia bacterium]MBN2822353.1 arsenic resistance protein [Coriobacteriia bacterium]
MSEQTVNPAVKILSRLTKHLVVLIPISMGLGLGAGLVVDMTPFKALILPMTMLMVYPMLVNFRPAEALDLKDSRAVGVAMVLDFLVLPVLAWGLAMLFFRDQPGLYVGMVLAGLFPTSGMTISWTGFARGNVGAAVKMTVIGLIAASLLAPVYLSVLAGKVVPVDFMGVLQTVVLVVAVPMVAGVITRKVLVRRYGQAEYKQRIAPVFPGLSTVGVLAIVFVAIGLKARMIFTNPQLVIIVLVPLVIFYTANFALSTVIGKRFLPRGDAIAVVYGTVMRNLSIALGIAVAQFGAEAALVLAAAYIVQVQSAAWYVKATPRVFGEPAEKALVSVARVTA